MMISSWFVSEISPDKTHKNETEHSMPHFWCSAFVQTHGLSGAITKMVDEIAQDGKVL